MGTPWERLRPGGPRPAHPVRLRPELQVGDGLHLNSEGYHTLAAAVPDRLFR